ncbi:glycine betaine/L-proline ABC transporter substrate-binding protein ProX [Pseudomonas guariconensis]|uniref:glycine betaine/L-proline ABC transporter substrate-binding protein ProX n=1 Tax=Pseudomonas TaxID=286 RepID=UPI0020973A64|nr:MULTISPECIES: glycine betaine/L-proline ABC transporter substrate-binding protein ProX [Pseudomonas]MCO7568206.1 glycine betaine/L-proline ABC transporter substrate-binding protein ProX [Pseudomonas mosselii]MCO7619881.1 glycine betaine/L-proline ABC transporter substrate-binding protein ProX [Pseudomonas guariconensis]
MKCHEFSNRLLAVSLFAAIACTSLAGAAQEMQPGKGVAVIPVKSTDQGVSFQNQLVVRGLKDLGYDVKEAREVEYATAHIAIANGDATFLAGSWEPLHNDFYEKSGGDAKLVRAGSLSANAKQGYLIDKKTADQHHITNIDQLKDPSIARLFDTDGDGKADLTGCTPGWACEKIIENLLKSSGLQTTVSQKTGAYSALMADVIARYKEGKPVLYYTWTPYYVSALLVPDKDVIWLEVPAPAGEPQPIGKYYGYAVNTQHVVANKAFVEANPAAGKFFQLVNIDVNDINAQNNRLFSGEKTPADIERHVALWIKSHQKTYNDWLAAARSAGEKPSLQAGQ